MAIIKFDKEKLFNFIREIQQKSLRNQSHYYIECDFKYRDENEKMSGWKFGGWCVPTDALDADDVILKEVRVRSENKYNYYLMFTDPICSDEQVVRYILDDRYLEAIGIERKRF